MSFLTHFFDSSNSGKYTHLSKVLINDSHYLLKMKQVCNLFMCIGSKNIELYHKVKNFNGIFKYYYLLS